MKGDPSAEILRRLEALERRLDHGGGHHHHDHRDHDHHDHGRREGGDFDEKRIVDLIVDLVGERVDLILERRLADLAQPTRPLSASLPDRPRPRTKRKRS